MSTPPLRSHKPAAHRSLTVPLSVIRLAASINPPYWPPYWASDKLLNVFWPSAGLDVFINAIE
jgi:hypothetical protein